MTTLGGRDWSARLRGQLVIESAGLGIAIISDESASLYVRADQLIDAETDTPPGGWREWTPQGVTVSGPYPVEQKCRFCGGHFPPFDEVGSCSVCVNGMARTNGD